MSKIERKIFRGILEKKLSEDDQFSDSEDEDYKQDLNKNKFLSNNDIQNRKFKRLNPNEYCDSPLLRNNFMERSKISSKLTPNYLTKFRQSENCELKDLYSKNSNDSQKFESTERPKTLAQISKEKHWANLQSNNDITSHANSLVMNEEEKCLETEDKLKDDEFLFVEKIE